MEQINAVLMIFIIFAAGFGWGRWYEERNIRLSRAAMENERINVSMPMNPEDAAAMMGLLKEFLEQIEQGKK